MFFSQSNRSDPSGQSEIVCFGSLRMREALALLCRTKEPESENRHFTGSAKYSVIAIGKTKVPEYVTKMMAVMTTEAKEKFNPINLISFLSSLLD